jgi:hypothetical protein
MAAREQKKKVLSSAEIVAKAATVPKTATFLPRNSNQAQGIAKYAMYVYIYLVISFMGPPPPPYTATAKPQHNNIIS